MLSLLTGDGCLVGWEGAPPNALGMLLGVQVSLSRASPPPITRAVKLFHKTYTTFMDVHLLELHPPVQYQDWQATWTPKTFTAEAQLIKLYFTTGGGGGGIYKVWKEHRLFKDSLSLTDGMVYGCTEDGVIHPFNSSREPATGNRQLARWQLSEFNRLIACLWTTIMFLQWLFLFI